MRANKVFQICLLASLTFHGIVLLQNSQFALFSHKIKEEKLEVSYVRKPEEFKPAFAKKAPFLDLQSLKITSQRLTPPRFIGKEALSNIQKKDILLSSAFKKPMFSKPDVIAIKKKITLDMPDNLKMNSAAYISYSQIVHEKLKRSLHDNYSGTQTGEVSIVFVLAKNGKLKDTRIIDEKSSANPYLKDVVLRSLKDTVIFPAFPKELDYPELSFSVTISFEIE